MKEITFLLGATKDGELAFGNFRIENYDVIGRAPYFAASFDTVKPFDVDDIDEDYAADYLEGLDTETKYNLCERLCCAPQDLACEFYENSDIDDLVDCSLYPAEVKVCNITFKFESVACGQHDLTGEMAEFTNRLAFWRLIGLWKTFHLKPLTDKDEFKQVCDELTAIVKLFNKVDEDAWIKNYLKHNYANNPEVDEEDVDDEDAE